MALGFFKVSCFSSGLLFLQTSRASHSGAKENTVLGLTFSRFFTLGSFVCAVPRRQYVKFTFFHRVNVGGDLLFSVNPLS